MEHEYWVDASRARLRLVQGDIAAQRADAIVTAANSALRGGGGVDGAVHRAAGPALLEACRELGGCPVGSAVITPSFELAARGIAHVIHAVGPIWRGGAHGEERDLERAYYSALLLAERAGCRSVAMPSLSTGAYGFPVERAAPIALRAAASFLAQEARSLGEVIFVSFDGATYNAFAEALAALRS